MIVQLKDGRTVRNVSGFWEYGYVLKHTEDLERLKRLHRVRVMAGEATKLVELLTDHFSLSMPNLLFAGRTDRGTFWDYHSPTRKRNVVIVRPEWISVECLIHEVTHHWVVERGINVPSYHGEDFVPRLDRLAEATDQVLAESRLTFVQWGIE